MSKMEIYWASITGAWFVGFFIAEFTALWSGHPENTLSFAVWKWLGVIKGQPITQWSFLHFAVIGIFTLTAIWLIGHFGWMDWT